MDTKPIAEPTITEVKEFDKTRREQVKIRYENLVAGGLAERELLKHCITENETQTVETICGRLTDELCYFTTAGAHGRNPT